MHSLNSIHVTLSAQAIALLTLILPALTALITRRFADSWVKALVLLLLTAVASVVPVITSSEGFEAGAVFWTVFITFLTSALVHFGLLQPIGVTGSEGVIAKSVPGGVGKKPLAG